MTRLLALMLAVAASPAMAASGPFFSLRNTNFVVLLAFIIFVAALIFLKVPGKIAEMLDKRAVSIRSELDEARALREEAQTVLASFERKQAEVQAQADRIVASARDDANRAAEQAKEDLQKSIARRLAAAEEQIASAQAGAVKEVRDRAVTIAIAAAKEVLAKQMTATEANRLIDDSIRQAEQKLH